MPIARRAPPHLPPQRQLEEACRLIEAGATGGGLAGLLAAAAALFPQNAAFDRWSPDRPPGGARPPAYPPRGSPPGPPGRSRGSGRGDRDLEEDGRDRPAGKLLFLAASPTDMPHLRYGKEWEAIRCVASSPSAVGVEVVPRFAVSPEGLLDAVTREKPSFLHFCGHGEASGHIVLEGPEGGPLYLSVERLAEIIRAANTVGRIRLVCLNACYVAGVADVLCQDVEVVVGSTTAIFDELAIIFARRFYFSLLEGYPLVAAVTLGRQSMELHLEESPALAERWRTVVARQKTTITNEVIIRHHQDVDPRTWALQRR